MRALGMSLRSAGDMLSTFGEPLSHASVWRDVQEAGENARRSLAERAPGRASAVGADETHVRVKGKKKIAGVVTDARTGQVIGLDMLVEQDSDAFMDWIGRCADEFGVEAIAADDLNTCKPVVERFGIDHQICMAHLLKWVWSRLGKIDGMDWFKALIWRLLKELPANGGLELPRLERLVRDAEDQSLRRPRVELSNKWRALLCHRRRGDVPWTNNVTERAIGRSKIRGKTTRGVQERIGDVERVLADAVGLERVGRLGVVGAGRGVKPRVSA